MVRGATAEFAAAECLLERAELQFDAPPLLVHPHGLRQRQRGLVEHTGHQIDLAARALKLQQPQHQRRFLATRHGGGPKIDQILVASSLTQSTDQAYVATHANEQVMFPVENRFPQFVADETGVATKQRITWKNKALEQVEEMVPLARGRRPGLPAPGHSQAHVPDERQPDLRLHMFGQSLGAALFVAPFLPRLRRSAAAIILSREGPFVALGARGAGPRTIDG